MLNPSTTARGPSDSEHEAYASRTARRNRNVCVAHSYARAHALFDPTGSSVGRCTRAVSTCTLVCEHKGHLDSNAGDLHLVVFRLGRQRWCAPKGEMRRSEGARHCRCELRGRPSQPNDDNSIPYLSLQAACASTLAMVCAQQCHPASVRTQR